MKSFLYIMIVLYSYTSDTKYKRHSNRMTQANRNNV